MPDAQRAISQLKSSANIRQLVVVAGTGSSMALTGGKNSSLSWRGLIEDGFEYSVARDIITPAQRNIWRNQLESSDIDDLLLAAEFIGLKLGAPSGHLYANWLQQVFKEVTPEDNAMANAVLALQSKEIPICTLNYDLLLEKVTGLPSINLTETAKVVGWMRREERGILHLHGIWNIPTTCILGIRDYETTLKDDFRDLTQRVLTSLGQLLFIGCGDTFADPNFSALIGWLRQKIKTGVPQHYGLVSSAEAPRRQADPSWRGFVDPISYGTGQQELPAFLLNLFPKAIIAKPRKKSAPKRITSVDSGHARILDDYKAFLLRDCGQMTIEGVRADIDTAQRRFDLERLFVPLKALPLPPEISASDPDREQKLLKWREKNRKPIPFGQAFEKNRHVALLALPGGGKTLLLKRLAVAYADSGRIDNSTDQLPKLDVIPVLIRCREWKEHIRRPISVLLENMSSITGQASLADFKQALTPLLKRGRVLLLVDGLDEIHDDADRSTFVDNLESFLDEYKLIRLVVTSREAGFNLVAPAIARFCDRWRVAPLEPDAIHSLCRHWHQLMSGESADSLAEAAEFAERLLQHASLNKLADNPLLLTMLLVVKRGAGGRLPPDRAGLYDRAVEVLLDTWNIKGHEPLNVKEAVPQLACVAFELMRRGKQTATESELLALLNDAREKLPNLQRFAKDRPDQFLKRVELRSGLLVEAGHQLDGARTVPFYQFRHLTFQEHLAAVAAAGGHYIGYQLGDTLLTPLAPHLVAEEWKEVVPMAAVLAKKQAEPLIASLVDQGNRLRQKLEFENNYEGFPAPVARLMQCFAEEAEASTETLMSALQLIALFARGFSSVENWKALSSGPYGKELLEQAWTLYKKGSWPQASWLRNTLAVLLVNRKHITYWNSDLGEADLLHSLRGDCQQEIAGGLLTIGGIIWRSQELSLKKDLLAEVDRHLFHDDPVIFGAALWVWVVVRNMREGAGLGASPQAFDRFLSLWLDEVNEETSSLAAHAFAVPLEFKPETGLHYFRSNTNRGLASY